MQSDSKIMGTPAVRYQVAGCAPVPALQRPHRAGVEQQLARRRLDVVDLLDAHARVPRALSSEKGRMRAALSAQHLDPDPSGAKEKIHL